MDEFKTLFKIKKIEIIMDKRSYGNKNLPSKLSNSKKLHWSSLKSTQVDRDKICS